MERPALPAPLSRTEAVQPLTACMRSGRGLGRGSAVARPDGVAAAALVGSNVGVHVRRGFAGQTRGAYGVRCTGLPNVEAGRRAGERADAVSGR